MLMYHTFGGIPWLTWYLAIGDAPADLAQMANDYLKQQAEEKGGRVATTEPHPCPKLSARGRARRAGKPLPQRTGVRHKIAKGKTLRRAAGKLDKKIEKVRDDWNAGLPTMGDKQWRRLLGSREAGCAIVTRRSQILST